MSAYDFLFPVTGGKITSAFGTRQAPISGASTNHAGVDISVPVGTIVGAILPGRVLDTGWNKTEGYNITVDHGGGTTSIYKHLQNIIGKVGDTVTQGQKIATSGSTGLSSGPHLHLEIRQDGKAVNPLTWKKPAASAKSGIDSALNGLNTDNFINLIKSFWLPITAGLLILAIVKKG